MALDLNTVSFVGGAIKLAWEIYNKGFRKETSSPQRYIEFGSALHGLYTNLKTIQTIVTKANNDLESERIGQFGPSSYDIAPLAEIIGDFKLTLNECRDLLNDESKFSQKNGVITNIIYNIDVDPYVVSLTERLAFHSNKISLVLDPFKIHLQSTLRDLQKETHQDMAEIIHELRQLVVTGLDLKNAAVSPAPPRDVEVPPVISERFVVACGLCGRSPEGETRLCADFPLKDGLEAFFYHFNGLSQAFDSMSYLRLLKSIWIMDRIRESNEWVKVQRSNPGGLYDRCIREMDRRLREECSRVMPAQIPLPELLLQLPEETFSIWPPVTPHNSPAIVSHLGVLLDLPVQPDPKSHTLRIVRNIDGTLGLEDTTMTTMEHSTGTLSSERRIQTLNIDPKSAYFVPIYAMPSETGASSAAPTVKLQSSRDGVNGLTPTLESLDDLYRLQHLVTGFKCVKQRSGITIASLADGQQFPSIQVQGKKSKKMKNELYEFGHLQLWQKVPFEAGLTPSTSNEKPDKRASGVSYAPTTQRSIGSSMSFSTVGTRSTAHARQVSFGLSGTGIQFNAPQPPCLVLFLKEREGGLLSFLVVELDELTHINPLSCACASSKKPCTVSVLERSRKPLLARRFYAREGLNSWNLAALGEYWPTANNGAVQVQNMYWLKINFRHESERVKFTKNIESLVKMFTFRMEDYRKDLSNIRGTHIISRRGW
ncbi:hypothetical protein M011DRAFT_51959 [Sporormia fimetaria CBS 119925]|uniref:Uncharacterized protein n=1 Tax=Sporormia fimetaria CBS 119925 TaxID=1340428 RepID=A0A6A6VBX6_9PLEO|nr:hypothetical protein M011DRAFT_51959 [Sporormia fimetaria CBS 119925]